MLSTQLSGRFEQSTDRRWSELEHLLRQPSRVVILTHKNPDGDAVGSALGMMRILNKAGHHRVSVIIPDSSPAFLRWLPGHSSILIYERNPESAAKELTSAELVIMVDFNDPERLGTEIQTLLEKITKPSVLIDHHPGGTGFARYNFSFPQFGSTAELIYEILKRLRLIDLLDTDSATCLLTGIITDTLGFKVSSSSPALFRTVADLLEYGVKIDEIFNRVYNQFSAERLRFTGYCLSEKMVILPDLQTAYIWLTKEEMNRFSHQKGDTEGLVNYPLSIAGISIAVLFTEQDDHIKLSLRSKGDLPVNELASKYFKGGGHLNAAGGKSYRSMKETLAYFEKILKEFLNQPKLPPDNEK